MELSKKAQELIALGNTIIGTTAGTFMSINSQSPESIVAGSIIGNLLPQVLNDFSTRVLSKREKIKVGAVTQFAINKIYENLEKGKTINTKFILRIDEENWSSGEELFEGVLNKAKNEAQVKKVKFIGSIYGNSVFIEDISPEDVSHLLSVVDNLTFRKLCIISLYGKKNEIFDNYNLMKDPYISYPNIKIPFSTLVVLQDIFDLGNIGIIDLKNSLSPASTFLTPAKYDLTEIGQKYFELMSLDEIKIEDLNDIIKNLEYKNSYGINEFDKKNGVKV